MIQTRPCPSCGCVIVRDERTLSHEYPTCAWWDAKMSELVAAGGETIVEVRSPETFERVPEKVGQA